MSPQRAKEIDPGRIVGLPQGPLVSRERQGLTQADYTPTPFRDSSWERLDRTVYKDSFSPLTVEMVKTAHIVPDPMFTRFSPAEEPEVQTEDEDGEAPAPAQPAAPAIDIDALVASVREEVIQEITGAFAEREEQLRQEYQRWAQGFAESVQGALQEFYEKVEAEAVRLSVDIARKIVHVTFETTPDYVYEVIRAAMSCVGAGSPHTVRVSPQDYEFLQVVGLPDDLTEQERGVTYIADESVKSGCVIETDFGRIDARLDEMWERISTRLLGDK